MDIHDYEVGRAISEGAVQNIHQVGARQAGAISRGQDLSVGNSYRLVR